MEKYYKDYIKDIVNEIRDELILNKKDIIFDNKYSITLFGDIPIIKDINPTRPFAYNLYIILIRFLADDYTNTINKAAVTGINTSLLKATIKYIKNKYDIASKYFS